MAGLYIYSLIIIATLTNRNYYANFPHDKIKREGYPRLGASRHRASSSKTQVPF